MSASPVRITAEETLSTNWYILKKYSFDLRRRDGRWQAQQREVYDRGNGATILLYNLEQRTVLLTRQFRMPAFVNDHSGYLIEAAAGLLDNAGPEQRIRQEAEEETGYRVGEVRQIYAAFMSPGSVTERIHFFIGQYRPGDRIGSGGGLEEEGEDIEVLELGFEQALAMVEAGEIVDGKTIMLLQYLALNLLPRSRLLLLLGPEASTLASWTAGLFAAGHVALSAPSLPDAAFQANAQRLLQRCDGLLRSDGPCAQADALVAMALRLGVPVYRSLAEVPPASSGPMA
ncbi:NUDIX domain-containing protein [Pseudomonas sp. MAFF 302030]|jgi:ADP-ribose pyrophosphatase|uniref:GDP-mannose pyrophosphatase n=1 Tax=Pseudomonas morbosilactucae TaxID=2938197 RepID=A0A9X1YV94_9PSED|nr:NUDIX domain-containing protein [Pseudomonas morbosilactucae]MCK9797957.1 NUDIX domain-containing protein [Pseudomonas morbosilactucae]